MLPGGKEIHTSEGDEHAATTLLYCSAGNLQNAFFMENDATSAKHELRILFSDNEIEDISYVYKGEFDSEEMAGQRFAAMRSKYNIYMTKTSIGQEALTPVFVVIEKSVNINLFFDKGTFVAEMMPLVFLNQEDYEDVIGLPVDGVKSLYETLGFSCNINQ